MTTSDYSAPLPPSWLNSTALPIYLHSAQDPLYRVYRSRLGPVFFGPGSGNPPSQRYDSKLGSFGVLYVAPGPDACLIETLLRRPSQRMVAEEQLETRSISELYADRNLELVDMLGANLSKLGTTGALHTGPYDAPQAWSDALFSHPDTPDGILYSSRHDPDEPCIALFERADFQLTASANRELMNEKHLVAQVLKKHGKSLSPKAT